MILPSQQVKSLRLFYTEISLFRIRDWLKIFHIRNKCGKIQIPLEPFRWPQILAVRKHDRMQYRGKGHWKRVDVIGEIAKEWTGLDWTGLDWTGLDWTGLDWTGLDWTGLDWTGLDWTGLDWTGLEKGSQT